MLSFLVHLTKLSPYIWFGASATGLLATSELIRRLLKIRKATVGHEGVHEATTLLIKQALSRIILMVLYSITGILALVGQADESAAPIFRLFVLVSLLLSPILLTMSSYFGLRYPKGKGTGTGQ